MTLAPDDFVDPAPGPRRGAYFLANDRIIELVRAFLNSFRQHNPSLPLRFIPFDDNASTVARLCDEYGVAPFSDLRVLQECDAISREFHGRTRGHYRKLACWEGDLDEFVYIDVDTVLLAPIDFVFGVLSKFDFITSHSDRSSLEKWVWKPGIRRNGTLTERQIQYSANTGVVASRREALTLARARSEAPRALALSCHMNLACHEQAFLNYLIVTSGKRFSSLALLASTGNPHASRLEYWAGRAGAVVGPNGTLERARCGPKVLLVHWAGEWQPRMWQRWLRGCLRRIGIDVTSPAWEIRFDLPYATLWKHYRELTRIQGEHTGKRVAETPTCSRSEESPGGLR